MEEIYDLFNNSLERCERIKLVKELNPHLVRPAAPSQVSCHITPKAKLAGYIKGFVTPQPTTTDRYTITVEHQFRWNILVEEQYKILGLNNDGVCLVSGKYFGEIMQYFIFGLDNESICADHHCNVNIIGSTNKKKHAFFCKIVEFP